LPNTDFKVDLNVDLDVAPSINPNVNLDVYLGLDVYFGDMGCAWGSFKDRGIVTPIVLPF
jgi:hypothetical protein